ncbi:hypothetical protein TNCV_1958861 [Trichonephila clavipes]|nr:hypothetical protein TNCV_1958861 [Trichonephila clavipes]
MFVQHDATEHGCDHLDVVNRNWINLKKIKFRHLYTRFVVDHTIEDAPVCDAASRAAVSMVSKLRVHAAANVIELFVSTLVL